MRRKGREGDEMDDKLGMRGEEQGEEGESETLLGSQGSGFHQLSVKKFYQFGVHHFKSQRLGELCVGFFGFFFFFFGE